MKAYKITDKNGECRGFKYEVGKKYKHDGNISLCNAGFHACIEPMDCMKYQDIYESKLFEVECSGEINKDDDKLVCSTIEIVKELSLKEYLDLCFESIERQCKQDEQSASGDGAKLASSGDGAQLASSGDGAKLASSGDGAQLASSGDGAKLASSGYGAQLASSGDGAQLASSGYGAQLASSGYGAQLASSGYWAQLASSGYGAKLASSGDGAKLASSGDGAKLASSGDGAQLASSGDGAQLASSGYGAQLASSGDGAVVAGIGFKSRVKVDHIGSWIVLSDYRDEKPHRVVAVKPGQIVDDITVKIKHWYWFEDGKLMEEKDE